MSADAPPAPLAGPVVIDASTVVEYLVVLTLTDAATRLLHRAADGRVELWAPDLVYSESVSALRKLVRLGALAEAPAKAAVDHLSHLPIIATGTAALMPDAWRMRAFLTPYDACYVALAEALGAAFVTAERNLAVELRKRNDESECTTWGSCSRRESAPVRAPHGWSAGAESRSRPRSIHPIAS